MTANDCPVCGEQPKVTEFSVNPMFGGGTAYECRCPKCGFGTGAQWRDEDAAILDWNTPTMDYYFETPDWEEDEQ